MTRRNRRSIDEEPTAELDSISTMRAIVRHLANNPGSIRTSPGMARALQRPMGHIWDCLSKLRSAGVVELVEGVSKSSGAAGEKVKGWRLTSSAADAEIKRSTKADASEIDASLFDGLEEAGRTETAAKQGIRGSTKLRGKLGGKLGDELGAKLGDGLDDSNG